MAYTHDFPENIFPHKQEDPKLLFLRMDFPGRETGRSLQRKTNVCVLCCFFGGEGIAVFAVVVAYIPAGPTGAAIINHRHLTMQSVTILHVMFNNYGNIIKRPTQTEDRKQKHTTDNTEREHTRTEKERTLQPTIHTWDPRVPKPCFWSSTSGIEKCWSLHIATHQAQMNAQCSHRDGSLKMYPS